MPFKSKSQMRRFGEMLSEGKITKEKFDEWAHATPHPNKLPERIGPRNPKVQKVKVIK